MWTCYGVVPTSLKKIEKKEQELIFSSYVVFLCWFISCVAISWIVVYLQTLV